MGVDAIRVIKKVYDVDTDHVTLYPLADIHWGSRECREADVRGYVADIAADPHAAVVLCGDLINNGIKSSVTDVYTEKYSPGQQKREMVELLRPIRDKIICVVYGNHCYRSMRDCGIDITQDMCRELGIEHAYAGDMGFVKLSLGRKANGKPATYTIMVTHGAGGGGTLGSAVNGPDRLQSRIEGLDISISGHTHRPSKMPAARLVLDPRNNQIMQSKTLIFVCTAWLDYGGYAAQASMQPVAFHPDTIRLDGREKRWE